MKMLTRLMALAMALMMCCCMALAEPAADDVMLTVNGTPVTRAQYENHLAILTDYYASAGYDTTDASLAAMLQQWALQTGVEYAVMDQLVAEKGLALSEADKAAAADSARTQWEAVIADGMEYYGITDESTEEERASALLSILAELEAAGYTEESYIEESITYAAYDKLYAVLTEGVTVSEEDVIAYFNNLVEADKAQYEGNAAAFEQTQQMNQLAMMYGLTDYYTEVYYQPSGYRAVNHILLIPEDETLVTTYSELQATYEEQQLTLEEGGELTGEAVSAEQVEAARLAILAAVQPTIDEINGKLEAGEAFNDLIPLYGQDPGMSDPAAIAEGYQVHMDSIMWDPVFTNAAMSIAAVGGVSEPVVGMNGVHIVHYDHDVPAGGIELTEEMKSYFQEALLASDQDEVYYAAIEAKVGEAVIEYSEEAKTILGVTE